MLKRIFLIAVLMLVSVTAYSEVMVVDGLSETQIAQMKADAAKLVADNAAQKAIKTDPGFVLSNAATWGTQASAAAKGFAEAIGIAAHELNVNVNDFIATPAGKLTVAVIIWKTVGTSIVKILGLIVLLFVNLIIVRVLYIRTFTKSIEIHDNTWFWGLYKTKSQSRIMKSFSDLDNDGEWMVFWIIIVLSVVGPATILFNLA